WQQILNEWPGYGIDAKEGLMFSEHVPYFESHRHFSHLMAIHPLGLIDWENGEGDRRIIENTIKNLDEKGPGQWTGYSYSWEGNLKARARDGEGAAEALRIFAEAFCLPNSFHVNGDQSGKGYSGMTYRPFTLEGNFAFASGINEMLIQSHTGIVRLFPAIPAGWQNVSFENIRTEGAFLVSSIMKNREIVDIQIRAEKGGMLVLDNSFSIEQFDTDDVNYSINDNLIIFETEPGEKIRLRRK
ncbi:MAG: hypothetical protein KAI99_14720, partial [Cyclobacteriaceae bacterium]|nr:hypothetical protein [Cyclobacteriaceae bacterium]